jgi:hypothetical protein
MSIIIPANSAAGGGFAVDNSCRFNNASDDSLTRSLGASETSLKKGTLSFWIKRAEAVGTAMWLYSNEVDNDNNRAYIEIDSNDNLRVINSQGGANPLYFITDAEYRDSSAWSHFVIAIDTTQGTESNRVKIYNNGVQITSFSQATYPSVNTDLKLFEGGQTNKNHIGNIHGQSAKLSAYLSEFVYIDGTQNAATDFGEFDADSGIWKPIDVSGLTFGNNGVYLDFEDSGALGADVSGNTNNFTVNNLTAIDQTTDTPTNNFITLNPLIGYTSQTDNQVYSEGNTIIIPNSTDNYGTGSSTIGLKGGKWYWEAQIVWNGTSNNANFPRTIGFCTENYLFNYSYLGQDGESWGIIFADAATDIWRLEHGGSSGDISGATTMANGGTMNLALDLDNGKFYVGYNGTFFTSGDPTSGATGTGAIATLDATDLSKYIFPAVTNATNSTYYKFNFGNPAYAISSGNTDGNDRGNFEFTVPSGYLSICTANLSEVLG